MEKVSQRMETLKREDPVLEVDIIDFFWKMMAETQKQLGIQPDVSILGSLIVDEALRSIFHNLIKAGPLGKVGAP